LVLLLVVVGLTVRPFSRAASLVGDLNADGAVNTLDLSVLISKWGTTDAASDLNHDGKVNIFDLSSLLSHWNQVSSTPTPTRTPTPTPKPTSTPAPTPAPTSTPVAGGGGICTNPFASTSVARGDINIGTGPFQVRNEAWNDTHGPQTIYACSEQSWYVTSNQPDNGGAVETYPDSLYSISGSKTIAQYTSITSTFSEAYPAQGDWNAAYDNWMNNFSKEVMIWNEWNGSPGYWPTQAKTAVSLGGVPYHFYNNGGELMFFRDSPVKSGSVDILAAYKWLVSQNLLSSSDVPTQIEYGLEICATVGTQRFDTTGFTVSLK